MTSEIRANTLKNRVGLGTISFTNTGPVVSGIVTATGADINGDLDVDGHTNLDNVSVAGIITSAVNVHTPYVYISSTQPGVAFNDTDGENDFTIGAQQGIWKLRDADANVDRYQVNSSGQHTLNGSVYIGVGNVTINKDLDVDGHTNLDNVSISGITTFSGQGIRIANATNPFIHLKDTTNNTDSYLSTDDGGSLYLKADDNQEGSSTKIVFQVDGSEKIHITSGGSVNIGGNYGQTTHKLYVDGTAEFTSNITCVNQIYLNGVAPQLVFTDTNQDSDFTIKNDSGSLAFIDRTNSNAIRMYANAGGFGGDRLYIANDIVHTGDIDTKIEFSTDTINFDTAGTERLRIDSAGSVLIGGIRTSNTGFGNRVLISGGTLGLDGNGSNIGMHFHRNSGDTEGYIGIGPWAVTGGADDDFGFAAKGNLLFGTSSNTWSEKMRISNTGQVRIPISGKLSVGHTNPSARFTVGPSNGSTNIEIEEYGVIRGYNRNSSAWSKIDFEASYYVFDTDGSEKFRISSAGYVTKPETPSWVLRPSYSSNQTLGSGTHAVGWSSSDYNTHAKAVRLKNVTLSGSGWGTNLHNGQNYGKIVVPVAGIYRVWCTIRMENTPTTGNLFLYVDGSQVVRQHVEMWQHQPYMHGRIEHIVNLNANSYIIWALNCNGGVVSGVQDTVNWCGGHLIG